MTFTRRSLLRLPLVLAGPLAGGRAQAAGAAASSLGSHEETLASFVDTLLPAEGGSPAASELGVARAILGLAWVSRPLGALLRAGCEWLDAAARAAGQDRFAALDEAAREAVVTGAERGDAGPVPAQLFAWVHREAVELFYSDPRAWPALGYPGPPQPVGFPDQHLPPGGSGG